MADDWLTISRKVRSKLFCLQIFFYLPTSKIHDFNLAKHTPQKALFLGGGVRKIRPVNLEVTCAENVKNMRFHMRQKSACSTSNHMFSTGFGLRGMFFFLKNFTCVGFEKNIFWKISVFFTYQEKQFPEISKRLAFLFTFLHS